MFAQSKKSPYGLVTTLDANLFKTVTNLFDIPYTNAKVHLFFGRFNDDG